MAQTVKNPLAKQETGFHPCVRKTPWRRAWQPTAVFLPGDSHGQKSLVGYSQWGRRDLDTTERPSTAASPPGRGPLPAARRVPLFFAPNVCLPPPPSCQTRGAEVQQCLMTPSVVHTCPQLVRVSPAVWLLGMNHLFERQPSGHVRGLQFPSCGGRR